MWLVDIVANFFEERQKSRALRAQLGAAYDEVVAAIGLENELAFLSGYKKCRKDVSGVFNWSPFLTYLVKCKRQGLNYTIDTYVQGFEKNPCPGLSLRLKVPPTEGRIFQIGTIPNPDFELLSGEYSKFVKEIGEPYWEGEMRAYRQAIQEWETKPLSYWEELLEQEGYGCSRCEGEGSTLIGSCLDPENNGGTEPCENCDGTGRLSAEKIRSQHKPLEPQMQLGYPGLENLPYVRVELSKRGITKPHGTLEVYLHIKTTDPV